MKLNLDKVSRTHGAVIDGETYKYGWYRSGKAFIAKDGELLTYAQAYKTFVPKHCYHMSDRFFVSLTSYAKTIDGIVRYLIDKYNKD